MPFPKKQGGFPGFATPSWLHSHILASQGREQGRHLAAAGPADRLLLSHLGDPAGWGSVPQTAPSPSRGAKRALSFHQDTALHPRAGTQQGGAPRAHFSHTPSSLTQVSGRSSSFSFPSSQSLWHTPAPVLTWATSVSVASPRLARPSSSAQCDKGRPSAKHRTGLAIKPSTAHPGELCRDKSRCEITKHT